MEQSPDLHARSSPLACIVVGECERQPRACRILNRKIQDGSHDSVDDARAALELALIKVKRGPDFEAGGRGRGARPLAEVLAAKRRRVCVVDRAATVRKFVHGDCSGIAADTDADAVRALPFVTKEIQNDRTREDTCLIT